MYYRTSFDNNILQKLDSKKKNSAFIYEKNLLQTSNEKRHLLKFENFFHNKNNLRKKNHQIANEKVQNHKSLPKNLGFFKKLKNSGLNHTFFRFSRTVHNASKNTQQKIHNNFPTIKIAPKKNLQMKSLGVYSANILKKISTLKEMEEKEILFRHEKVTSSKSNHYKQNENKVTNNNIKLLVIKKNCILCDKIQFKKNNLAKRDINHLKSDEDNKESSELSKSNKPIYVLVNGRMYQLGKEIFSLKLNEQFQSVTISPTPTSSSPIVFVFPSYQTYFLKNKSYENYTLFHLQQVTPNIPFISSGFLPVYSKNISQSSNQNENVLSQFNQQAKFERYLNPFPYYRGNSADVSFLLESLMWGYDKRLRPSYKG